MGYANRTATNAWAPRSAPASAEGADVAAKPLSSTFERPWRPGELPEHWKKANATPVLKKGTKGDPGNHRPVSPTSPGRATEQLVLHAISSTRRKGGGPGGASTGSAREITAEQPDSLERCTAGRDRAGVSAPAALPARPSSSSATRRGCAGTGTHRHTRGGTCGEGGHRDTRGTALQAEQELRAKRERVTLPPSAQRRERPRARGGERRGGES